MNRISDDMEDPSNEYLLEEIRNESIMFASMCNCKPGNDGEPCPHGHFNEGELKQQSEAEWAKEQLKDWHYEEEEDEDEEPDFILDDSPEKLSDAEADELIEEEAEMGLPETGEANLMASEQGNDKPGKGDQLTPGETGASGVDADEEWYFDEVSQEWKAR